MEPGLPILEGLVEPPTALFTPLLYYLGPISILDMVRSTPMNYHFILLSFKFYRINIYNVNVCFQLKVVSNSI